MVKLTHQEMLDSKFYKRAAKLVSLGFAIVPTYPGYNGSAFDDSTQLATTLASKIQEWMMTGYPLKKGLHQVTPDHNWVCVAKETGNGCLDIDDYQKCVAIGNATAT